MSWTGIMKNALMVRPDDRLLALKGNGAILAVRTRTIIKHMVWEREVKSDQKGCVEL